jgi:hypothetical protein
MILNRPLQTRRHHTLLAIADEHSNTKYQHQGDATYQQPLTPPLPAFGPWLCLGPLCLRFFSHAYLLSANSNYSTITLHGNLPSLQRLSITFALCRGTFSCLCGAC